MYLSPEAVERIERELAETREKGLQEYADLKALLLKRTWRFGTLFALYLLLTASAEVRRAAAARGASPAWQASAACTAHLPCLHKHII